ncbi:DUF348 domain-containing protein [Anaerolineae bacterium CFX9]|nr:DUF348 domain-containing protein [Anaerolineae bacterium CFX9]
MDADQKQHDTQPITPAPPHGDTQPIAFIRNPSPFRRPRLLLWLLLAAGAAAALIISVSSGVLLLAEATRPISVTLIVDGRAQELNTRMETVADLLTEAALITGEGDRVTPGLETALRPDMIIRVERAHAVTISLNGSPRTVYTTHTNPAAILREAGIVIGDADRVMLDGISIHNGQLAGWNVPVSRITVRQPMRLTLIDGGRSQTIEAVGETVGDALFESEIELFLADSVTPPLNTPLEDGMTVTIERAFPITIQADGARIPLRLRGATVGDALIEGGIALVGQDYTVPSENAPLIPNMTIRVYRVTHGYETEDAAIPYERVVQPDPELEIDNQRVIQAGREGVQRTTWRIVYENGVEIDRQLQSVTTALEPQNEIVVYGTNVIIRTIDTPEGPLEYWRVFRVYATSYHPAALGGDDVTATGARLQRGIVGADPRLLPYGTRIYVQGYGTGVIADTGLPRRSTRWIDLGYSDEDWINWYRWVDVYLLTPVPEQIDYFPPP